MFIYKKKLIETEEVVDVECSKCKGYCRDKYNKNNEYATIEATWGFGSKKDGEKHTLHLCEECYDETIAHLGLNPIVKYYF